MEYNSRKEVPEKYKLNMQDYFQDENDWLKTLEEVKVNLSKLKPFQKPKLTAKEIEDFLQVYYELDFKLMSLYVYALVNHDLDLQNETYLNMINQFQLVNTIFMQETAFFEPAIISLNEEEFNNLFKENKNLEKYQVILNKIYEMKEHVLSENEEKLISLLTQTYSSYEDISSTLINSEHDYGYVNVNGKKIKIAANNVYHLKSNKDEKVRKKAYLNFAKTIKQYEQTESNLLNQHIENMVNLARIHHYNSAWEEKLKSIHISNEVFENLKKCAKDNKKSWQKYYHLMKDVLNLKVLHSYDTALNWNELDKKYSIEDAQKIILKALKVLGEDYTKRLEFIFKNNYIDYCQYKGKVGGGYSIYNHQNPARIVLSFNEDFDSLLTIAHEIGHSIHYSYLNDNNEKWYRGASTFVAEVASLTNEFLVNNYLALHGTKEEKLQGIEHTLKTFQNNFFDAILEAEVEQKMYEYKEQGGILTANYLNELIKSFSDFYLGNVIKGDKYKGISWITRSHYYMNFYLYSYALCAAVASIVARKIINKEEGFLEKYKEFLQTGTYLDPEDIYAKLGIDIKDSEVLNQAVRFFDEQLKLYQKIRKEADYE